jgi:hypothetical protein
MSKVALEGLPASAAPLLRRAGELIFIGDGAAAYSREVLGDLLGENAGWPWETDAQKALALCLISQRNKCSPSAGQAILTALQETNALAAESGLQEVGVQTLLAAVKRMPISTHVCCTEIDLWGVAEMRRPRGRAEQDKLKVKLWHREGEEIVTTMLRDTRVKGNKLLLAPSNPTGLSGKGQLGDINTGLWWASKQREVGASCVLAPILLYSDSTQVCAWCYHGIMLGILIQCLVHFGQFRSISVHFDHIRLFSVISVNVSCHSSTCFDLCSLVSTAADLKQEQCLPGVCCSRESSICCTHQPPEHGAVNADS